MSELELVRFTKRAMSWNASPGTSATSIQAPLRSRFFPVRAEGDEPTISPGSVFVSNTRIGGIAKVAAYWTTGVALAGSTPPAVAATAPPAAAASRAPPRRNRRRSRTASSAADTGSVIGLLGGRSEDGTSSRLTLRET